MTREQALQLQPGDKLTGKEWPACDPDVYVVHVTPKGGIRAAIGANPRGGKTPIHRWLPYWKVELDTPASPSTASMAQQQPLTKSR